MSVLLTTRIVGDVTIIDCAGRITLGEGAGSLREKISELAASNHKKVILNLAETSYIDSVGIGELMSGFTRLSNLGATLKLLALTDRVQNLLQITGLYSCFDVFEDENAAVRSFSE